MSKQKAQTICENIKPLDIDHVSSLRGRFGFKLLVCT